MLELEPGSLRNKENCETVNTPKSAGCISLTFFRNLSSGTGFFIRAKVK